MPREPLEQKLSWVNASTAIGGSESPWSVSASPSSGGAENSDHNKDMNFHADTAAKQSQCAPIRSMRWRCPQETGAVAPRARPPISTDEFVAVGTSPGSRNF